MGLLTGGLSIYNKNKGKKDQISQTAFLNIMEQSGSSKEFMKNMDEFLKNKEKEEISLTEQIKTQQNRLDLSDQYLAELPVEGGITATKQFGTMIGAGLVALAEQAGSAYIDLQVVKSRDILKAARWNNVKSAVGKGLGFIGSITAGATAGSVLGTPGVGTAVGAIAAGLLYLGSQVVNFISDNEKEKVATEESNREAEINRITLGDLTSTGNRKSNR